MNAPGRRLDDPIAQYARQLPDGSMTTFDDVTCECTLHTEQVFMDHGPKEEKYKPYLHFIGEVQKVQLPSELRRQASGIEAVTFPEGQGLQVDAFYNFDREELVNLVQRGYFEKGFDVPDIFVNNDFELPMSCNVMVVHPDKENAPPILLVGLNHARYMEFDDKTSEYDMPSYFREIPQSHLDSDVLDVQPDDEEIFEDAPKDTAEFVPDFDFDAEPEPEATPDYDFSEDDDLAPNLLDEFGLGDAAIESKPAPAEEKDTVPPFDPTESYTIVEDAVDEHVNRDIAAINQDIKSYEYDERMRKEAQAKAAEAQRRATAEKEAMAAIGLTVGEEEIPDVDFSKMEFENPVYEMPVTEPAAEPVSQDAEAPNSDIPVEDADIPAEEFTVNEPVFEADDEPEAETADAAHEDIVSEPAAEPDTEDMPVKKPAVRKKMPAEFDDMLDDDLSNEPTSDPADFDDLDY